MKVYAPCFPPRADEFWLIIDKGGLIILNQRSAYGEAVKRKE